MELWLMIGVTFLVVTASAILGEYLWEKRRQKEKQRQVNKAARERQE